MMTKHAHITRLETMKPSTASRVLFIHLYEHLKNTEPRVPVEEGLIGDLDELVSAILAGKPLRSMYGIWEDIFDGIEWTRVGQGSGCSCGAELLRFFGLLGEALQRRGSIKLSVKLALLVMIECQPEPRAVIYNQNGRRSWFEVTEEGVGALGLAGRLDFPTVMPNFEVARDFFERVHEFCR